MVMVAEGLLEVAAAVEGLVAWEIYSSSRMNILWNLHHLRYILHLGEHHIADQILQDYSDLLDSQDLDNFRRNHRCMLLSKSCTSN